MLRIICLSLALVGPAAAQDPVISYAADDPKMEAAIDEARRTLPLFLAQAVSDDGQSVPGALVKVEMPTVPGSPLDGEHIWVMPFARLSDSDYAGILANAPAYLGALQEGDRVDFTVDQISDWHFTAPSGRYWGSYTSRVMHEAGAFGDTPFDQIFEPEPVPADWR
jgi:uncharacterized protein YegJ (DUF2314 family)